MSKKCITNAAGEAGDAIKGMFDDVKSMIEDVKSHLDDAFEDISNLFSDTSAVQGNHLIFVILYLKLYFNTKLTLFPKGIYTKTSKFIGLCLI